MDHEPQICYENECDLCFLIFSLNWKKWKYPAKYPCIDYFKSNTCFFRTPHRGRSFLSILNVETDPGVQIFKRIQIQEPNR